MDKISLDRSHQWFEAAGGAATIKLLSSPDDVVEADVTLSSQAGFCLEHGQFHAVPAVYQPQRALQNPETKCQCPVNDR